MRLIRKLEDVWMIESSATITELIYLSSSCLISIE